MARRLALSLVLIVAGFIGGLVVTGSGRAAETPRAAEPSMQPLSAPPAASRSVAPSQPLGSTAALASVPDFTRIAALGVKGVANISSLQVRQRSGPFQNDPFFRYFFGDDDVYGERRSMSLGSGVIISADGYVITNNHVVGE